VILTQQCSDDWGRPTKSVEKKKGRATEPFGTVGDERQGRARRGKKREQIVIRKEKKEKKVGELSISGKSGTTTRLEEGE